MTVLKWLITLLWAPNLIFAISYWLFFRDDDCEEKYGDLVSCGTFCTATVGCDAEPIQFHGCGINAKPEKSFFVNVGNDVKVYESPLDNRLIVKADGKKIAIEPWQLQYYSQEEIAQRIVCAFEELDNKSHAVTPPNTTRRD